MNTKVRQKGKNNFGKYFFKLMKQVVFRKNYGKCGETIKLVTTEKRRNYFSIRIKLSYCQVFHRTFSSNKNEKGSNTYE